ncbi:dTMP kinase [Actinomadura decatromicini]|uniref:Thymidylate kinase n=1 Tax=Actinomadura decatromicini TaxID=2604572 RepID=A0A5D3FYG8_9ACTN|nr:dTMP kinase [Actinomadura decatromicini]TYK53059.1 dTMP kinase [Actinomadura decatromicini]
MNPNTTRGLLITLDGPGGAGKSTLAHAITTQLARAGIPAEHTTQPSPGPIGALARRGTHQFHGYTLACLVAADRYHHLDTLIRPALAAGTTIVCDRYTASSLVFQALDGVEQSFITHLNQHADPPDLAVFLTCHDTELRRRLTVRGSHGRFEDDPDITAKETLNYHAVSALYAARGIRVLELDSTTSTPQSLASRVVAVALALTSAPS